jgi:eukaryotic-like serine/threonine-protein kinase
MATESKVLYEFGPFRVDPDKQALLREDQPVPITPKAFETLLILVRHSRQVVTKDELMKAVWPDAFVEEQNLSQNIFTIRRALGETPEDRRYIVTVPGRGYRFAAQVRTVMEGGEDLVIESRSRSQMAIEQMEGDQPRTVPALSMPRHHKPIWKHTLTIIAVVLVALGAVFFLRRPPPIALGATNSVLIADFVNTTGDPVFDGTLRQGLEVQLQQSSFLSLISNDRIQRVLRMMNQPPNVRLTPDLAREVCQRTASAAVLEGSITSLGSQFVLGLRAENCRTGDILDQEQAQAARKEDVMSALSQIAAKFRSRIGESLSSTEKHDTPLAEATTSSLEALKAYSIGLQMLSSTGSTAALPHFKRATEIDPEFAMAYAYLGRTYGDMGESILSAESTTKAYQLRDRSNDQEKFFIVASYDTQVTGNVEKAQQTCELWAQTYPREMLPHALLAGLIYQVTGEYGNAVAESEKAIELDNDFAIAYDILVYSRESLGQLEEAEKTLQRASQRKLEIPWFLLHRYRIAFLRADTAGMERVAASGSGADEIANQESFSLAYAGQLQQARKMSQRAAQLALQNSQVETASVWETGAALQESFLGNSAAARQNAKEALDLSRDREVEYGAALALALSGDSARAEGLANDLERRFPEDTSVRFSYLPTLHALLALNQGQPSKAIDLLQVATIDELGQPRSSIHGFFGALYPVYVRGEAYLAARQGPAAAAEFQKILDHRGIVVSDLIGALAHLQLGRAYVLSGENTKAKTAYQDFLTLWKNADPGIPILKQAKAEYAKVQ